MDPFQLIKEAQDRSHSAAQQAVPQETGIQRVENWMGLDKKAPFVPTARAAAPQPSWARDFNYAMAHRARRGGMVSAT